MALVVDWLALRTRLPGGEVGERVRSLLPVDLSPRAGGWNGFTAAADLMHGEEVVGILAFGGAAMQGWCHLSITGKGCALVKDWEALRAHWRGVAEVRRLDLAHDVQGGKLTLQQVREAYEAGAMDQPTGARPVLRSITDSDTRAGDTLYVGRRGGARMLRVYEKGKQLLGRMAEGAAAEVIRSWVRVELELRAEDHPLPWEWVVGDGAVAAFRGHSVFTAGLVTGTATARSVRDPAREAELVRRIECARRLAGRLVEEVRARGLSADDLFSEVGPGQLAARLTA